MNYFLITINAIDNVRATIILQKVETISKFTELMQKIESLYVDLKKISGKIIKIQSWLKRHKHSSH